MHRLLDLQVAGRQGEMNLRRKTSAVAPDHVIALKPFFSAKVR
jgi:hypothetical protein